MIIKSGYWNYYMSFRIKDNKKLFQDIINKEYNDSIIGIALEKGLLQNTTIISEYLEKRENDVKPYLEQKKIERWSISTEQEKYKNNELPECYFDFVNEGNRYVDKLRKSYNASVGSVTSDMVNDVEFIMSFAKTRNAVNKVLNGDKVKFYGNLLTNGYLNGKEKISTDEFEEYIELINTLSYRELEYLSFFKEFSNEYNGRLVYQNWRKFCTEFRKKFPHRDVDSVFKRLQRTGFLSEVIETSDVEGETLSLDINSVGFEAESEFSRFNEIVLKTFYESQTASGSTVNGEN